MPFSVKIMYFRVFSIIEVTIVTSFIKILEVLEMTSKCRGQYNDEDFITNGVVYHSGI